MDNYLKIGTAEPETAYASREDVWSAIAATEKTLAKDVMLTDGWITLNPKKESKPFAVAIYMPTSLVMKQMLQRPDLPRLAASALKCTQRRRL